MHRFLVVLLLCLSTTVAQAQTSYFIHTLGYSDAEHTGLNNYRFGQASVLNGNYLYGTSDRFDGVGNFLGTSAWLYDRNTNSHRNISFTDQEHLSSTGLRYTSPFYAMSNGDTLLAADRYNGGVDYLGQSTWHYQQTAETAHRMGYSGTGFVNDVGYQFSTVFAVTSSGMVLGNSWKYNGATELGADAWMYNPSNQTNIQLGLLDAEHTSDIGFQTSVPFPGNITSQIVGYSARYNGGSLDLGQSSWVYLNGTHIKLGFTDADHTALNGTKYTDVTETRENGYIIGNSIRYLGDSLEKGQSAWIYLPESDTTRRLGFTGGFYTRDDNYEQSDARFLTDNLLLGHSSRYQFSNSRGIALWIHNVQANTTTQIGLTDAEHTASNNTQNSSSLGIKNATTLIGFSDRYSGINNRGTTAWTYNLNSGVTTRIGLTGTEHTAADGTKTNMPWLINTPGVVAGSADRYLGGSTFLGQSAWLYNPASTLTIDVSLTGATFTRDDGYRLSALNYLTSSGLAFGTAERYNGPDFNGNSLFVYDMNTEQTQILTFSIRPSDGFAEAHGVYWNESGRMLGYYTLFDASSNDLGSRAFSWSITDGFLDLGTSVFGGLTGNGWASLNNVGDPLFDDSLVGVGLLSDMSDGQMTYLLTAVPEVSTVVLGSCAGCLGIFVLWYLRRQKRLGMEREVETSLAGE